MSGKGRKGGWGEQSFHAKGQKSQKGQKGKSTSSSGYFEDQPKGRKGKSDSWSSEKGDKGRGSDSDHILVPTPCTDTGRVREVLWPGPPARASLVRPSSFKLSTTFALHTAVGRFSVALLTCALHFLHKNRISASKTAPLPLVRLPPRP